MVFYKRFYVGVVAESTSRYRDGDVHARILGCLQGLATGDAIGKQTETLNRDKIQRWYPDGIRGFEGTPDTVIPRYTGNRKREWRIGETTDDTERTIAVARAILADGDVKHVSVGRELLACTKCIHPGLRSLWDFHEACDPERTTDQHDGCGAAIRVAPVGIRYRSSRFEEIVRGVREASIPTHGGPLALAAAAATATAVSAAIDGQDPHEILALAERAAFHAECDRTGAERSLFAEAVRTSHADLSQWRDLAPARVSAAYFPNTPLTIVPLALTLAIVMNSAAAAILLAANVGGDSDSVASIAGAILGARFPDTVNPTWYHIVEAVNGHGLIDLAERLSMLRR
jgi:ADP-ribosylglycohydrolase